MPGSQDRSEKTESSTRILCYVIPVAMVLFARWLLPINIADDAYITFKVAANAGSGLGMVFNPGENTYVSTSPMWVLLLTAFRLLLGDVVLAAKTLGIIFEVLLVLSIVRFSERTDLGAKVGMFAAVLLLTNPVFLLTSFSGMELSLFLLIIVLTALALSQRQYMVAMVLGASAVWVRFDGLVVFAVSVAISLWYERQQLRRRPGSVFAKMIPGAAIMLGYILFGAVFFETWLPMSVQRKALFRADLISPEWFNGAKIVSFEFANVLMGKSAYWYKNDTAFLLLVIPFVIGGILLVVRKKWLTVPSF